MTIPWIITILSFAYAGVFFYGLISDKLWAISAGIFGYALLFITAAALKMI